MQVAFHAMCVKGYVHSLTCTGLSTFQISDPSLSEGGGGQNLGFTLCANEIVNEHIYNLTYKVWHTVVPHGSHIRDSDPCKSIPTSFMDL